MVILQGNWRFKCGAVIIQFTLIWRKVTFVVTMDINGLFAYIIVLYNQNLELEDLFQTGYSKDLSGYINFKVCRIKKYCVKANFFFSDLGKNFL